MKWLLIIALSASYLVDQRLQDREIAESGGVDEVLWLDPDTGEGLLLERAPRSGGERGSVLVLAGPETGPLTPSHAVVARSRLPFYGWHTYFARLAVETSSPDDVGRRLLAYAAAVREKGAETVIVIAEGRTGLLCVELVDALSVDGLVLINLPTDDVSKDLLAAVELPSLVLQEHPARWPEEYHLGGGVELHLMSPVDIRRADNRLLRKIRGWFKRRFA